MNEEIAEKLLDLVREMSNEKTAAIDSSFELVAAQSYLDITKKFPELRRNREFIKAWGDVLEAMRKALS